MKRTIVWIDSTDKDACKIRRRLKDYLQKSGLQATVFEACEVMESECE
ncbi:MAG: hypothetical protein NWE93_06120 [Candidatus Bathyarchaeota archaeon]|nr:hypothetical protein [Candidatus Bathyarchaeota archaeon]